MLQRDFFRLDVPPAGNGTTSNKHHRQRHMQQGHERFAWQALHMACAAQMCMRCACSRYGWHVQYSFAPALASVPHGFAVWCRSSDRKQSAGCM